MNETKMGLVLLGLGAVIGALTVFAICRSEVSDARSAALDHVGALEAELDRAQDAAARAGERATELADRQSRAVESVARIADNLGAAAVRNRRMGELIDSIIEAVGELEGVYLGLAGVSEVE